MKYKEIEQIKEEFISIGHINTEADFECYADGLFSYYLETEKGTHELSIINKHATFMAKEKIIDLLSLEGTFFISHTLYSEGGGVSLRTIFRLVDQQSYVDENLN